MNQKVMLIPFTLYKNDLRLEVTMLSKVKKVFLFLIIITVVAVLGILIYSHGRTYFNEEDEIGNTAGNLYNGGLFCEQDGRIYFSNDNDDGSLYVMKSDCTNIKKLHKDKAAYINADENYIYYVRANNTRENKSDFMMFNNTGVYRINQNGRGLKAFTANPGAYLFLKGNTVYFQRYDVEEGLYLYQYQIDGSKERLLVKDCVVPAKVTDDTLYYTGYTMDRDIHAYNLSSFTENTAYPGEFAYPIFMGNYIYYIDIKDDYKIYRMNLDGTDTVLLVDEQCSAFNITNSGKFLYYQVDNAKNNRICRLDLESMESATIMEGDYKQIHVTDQFVFFKDFNNKNTYIVQADKGLDVNTFNPPGPNAQ
jgi:hypothetical protein